MPNWFASSPTPAFCPVLVSGALAVAPAFCGLHLLPHCSLRAPGFTFAEMNALEDQFDTEQMLAEKRSGACATDEQAQREAKAKVVEFNPDNF